MLRARVEATRDHLISSPGSTCVIYILYSDDYEVYLGGNYRPEDEVLVERTDHLLTTCEALDIPLTLFCDVPCLLRYRELRETAFPDAVDLQLKDAVQRGHDVQMHIHPHWSVAGLVRHADNSVSYEVDLSRFLLGNWYPDGGADLRIFCANLFKNAKSYLEDLLAPISDSYRCIAFRAGGYGLQPNSGEIVRALLDAGVLIDSSIVPGMVLTTNVNRVDFSNVPRKANYFISPALGLDHASDEGVYEIPVLALRGVRPAFRSPWPR